MQFRNVIAALSGFVMLVAATTWQVRAADDEAPDLPDWKSISKEFYGDKTFIEDKRTVIVEAPDKAEDAAIVPITVYVSTEAADQIKSLRIIIDHNPMPMVGTFTFGRGAGIGPKTISTRVRFDTFSYIRAILETEDGKLYMGSHFVQAAGGCSGTALKDAQEAYADAGKMNLKRLAKAQKFASQRNQSMVTAEAQVMLKHPNYSGMQMDAVTGKFIPAKYLRSLDVTRSGELVFHMDAGISLSTNPNVRFTYGSVDNETLEAKAEDSDNAKFSATAVASGS